MPSAARMPACPCPDCAYSTPRHLVEASKGCVVNYYRCDDCGHVFALRRDHPNGPPIDVTPRKTDVTPSSP